MHEMSLAENVLQIIEDAAQQQAFTRVKTVWLEIGQLACVEPESLRFSFDEVTRDSVADQARLEIVEIAGQGRCEGCAHDVMVTELYEPCPNCGDYMITVTSGDEMRVKELEVE